MLAPSSAQAQAITVTNFNCGGVSTTNLVIGDIITVTHSLDTTGAFASAIVDIPGTLYSAVENNTYTANVSLTQAYTLTVTPTVADPALFAVANFTNNTPVLCENLNVGKSVDFTDIIAPTTLTYTITVSNIGTTELTGINLLDSLTQNGSSLTLTSGPTLVSGDADSDGNLDGGETFTYTASYDVTSADIADGNDIINIATFQSNEEADVVGNAATTSISPPPLPPPAPTFCSPSATLLEVNGGFETPLVPGAFPNFFQFPAASVPGWSTTDAANQIELWDTGFLGVPSDTGVQHAELNATSTGTLTGTGSVTSRAEMLYFWAHRARSAASETAALLLTDNAGGSTNFGNYTSGTGAWNTFGAIHVANPGATSYSAAHSTVLGGSLGNFHDSIQACQTFITLTKTELSRQDLLPPAGDSTGDTVTYRFVVSNPAGNERSVASVIITDDQIGTVNVFSPDSGDTNGNNLLDPGESWIRDEPYTLTRADLDNGSVTNIAFAQANTSDNTLQTDNATVIVTLTTNPSLSITKIADQPSPSANVPVGTTVNYTYVVTNNGNQTISNIALVDDVVNGSGTDPVPVIAPGNPTADAAPSGDSVDNSADQIWDTLAPGDEITFTGSYIVTQSDVDTLQ